MENKYTKKEYALIRKKFGLYHQIASLDVKETMESWVKKHDKRIKKYIYKEIEMLFARKFNEAKTLGVGEIKLEHIKKLIDNI